mgnify:CR=1 FL=1|tara:strand:- start:944 stop:1225 length:282 start_codon:yes stop_codon:yes gene_type:complete
MTKKEKLDVAIAKCFGRIPLTEEDTTQILDCDALSLVTDHGLNENQARLVALWCQHECQRMWGQGTITPKDTEELEACYDSPYKLHKHIGFRS